MKKYDVVALGELLIDFIADGNSEQGNPLFEANPGGAPCNVLAMLTNLGRKTGFIGKVGNDMFGNMLARELSDFGIDTKGLSYDDHVNTTLAFVKKTENNDRDFAFYRNPGADMMLCADDVCLEMVQNTKVFHFGSLSMSSENSFNATKLGIKIAKENNALLSFDPNLRMNLWGSDNEAKEKIEYGISVCDILKISDNEILWFTGLDDYDKAVGALLVKFPNIQFLFLSLGEDGSRCYYKDIQCNEPAFKTDNIVDTTGAGDTFCACVLHNILQNESVDFTIEDLSAMLKFANAAASIVITKKGALKIMPKEVEILRILSQRI